MAPSSGTHTKSRGTFKLPFYETRRQPGLAPSRPSSRAHHLQENSLSDCGVLGVLHCLHSSFTFCCVRGPFPQSFLREWTSKAKRHDRATGLHTSSSLRQSRSFWSVHVMYEGYQHLIPRVVLLVFERIWSRSKDVTKEADVEVNIVSQRVHVKAFFLLRSDKCQKPPSRPSLSPCSFRPSPVRRYTPFSSTL